jgi:hypothetical protein
MEEEQMQKQVLVTAVQTENGVLKIGRGVLFLPRAGFRRGTAEQSKDRQKKS